MNRGFYELESVDDAFDKTTTAMREFRDTGVGGRIIVEVKSQSLVGADANHNQMMEWNPPAGWTRTYTGRQPHEGAWLVQHHFVHDDFVPSDSEIKALGLHNAAHGAREMMAKQK